MKNKSEIYNSKIKDFLKENKIYFETIAVILLSIMALIVSSSQLKIAKHQLLLSEDPILICYPPQKGNDTPGKINITIENPSMSDLYEIKIFEDYFLATNPTNKNLKLIRYGAMFLSPNETIPKLKSKTSSVININYENTFKQLSENYSKQTGPKRMFVKILIKFRREVDGKEFQTAKVFVIGVSGQIWVDNDMRGMPEPFSISTERVKRMLGVVY